MIRSIARILGFVAVTFVAVSAHADDEVGLAEVIRAAVEYPLPAVADVIDRPVAAAPEALVVIGDANDDQTECDAKTLGNAIGVSMRVQAWGLDPGIAFTQPLTFWDDTRKGSETEGLRPAERVAKRIGATFWLRSSAKQEREGLHLRFELVDMASGTTRRISERVMSGAFAATLADMLADVLAPVGFSPAANEQARMQAWHQEPDAAFKDLRTALANNCAGADYAAEIERAAQAHPESPELAALHINAVAEAKGAKAVVPLLAEISADTAAHPVVRAISAMQRVRADDHHHDSDAITVLKELVAAYPQEPWTWDALADALASETVIYATNATNVEADVVSGPVANHPGYAQAIAIALADTQRWPNNYRASWDLAFALGQYADAVRGAMYPSQMSEEAARRYPKLMAAAGRATSHALDANSTQPALYAMRIDTEAAAGEDWYSTFNQAIALAPHSRMLYNKAMNYARTNWGGDARLRARIYHQALENNPRELWPAEVYRYYAGRGESYLTIHARVLWIALLLVIGVAVALWLRWRRQHS